MIDRLPASAWHIGEFALTHVIMHDTAPEEAAEVRIGMDFSAMLGHHWATLASA